MKLILDFFRNKWKVLIALYKIKYFEQSPWGLSFARLGLAFVIWYDYHEHIDLSASYLRTITNYDPKGILNFFHQAMPSIEQIDGWLLLKDVSLVLFVFGLFTRPASLLLLLCNLNMMGLFESLNRDGYWCHGSNVYLLTHIAFVFAQPGKLSLDHLLSKGIRKFPSWLYNPEKQYSWPIYLGQISVAFMFINGFFWKLYYSGLPWVFSDNMRNILVLQYEMTLFQDYPPLIGRILESEILYKGLALFNLLLQMAPVLALIFINRPWIRIIAGSCFVLETLGLYNIMGLNDLEWIALFVFFVDWNYFLKSNQQGHPGLIPGVREKKWIKWFSVVFVFLYLVCGYNFVHPKFCCTFNTYPFSAFPMYSANLAQEPFDKHFSYTKDGLNFEFEGYKSSNPISESNMVKKLNYFYYPTNKFHPGKENKIAVTNSIIEVCKNEKVEFDSLFVYFGYRISQAYPEKPKADFHFGGLFASISGSGTTDFIGFDAINDGNRLKLISSRKGFFQEVQKFEYLCPSVETIVPLLGFSISGDTLLYETPCPNSGMGTMFIYMDTLSKEIPIERRRIHTMLHN